MKKYKILSIVLILVLLFYGCGNESADKSDESSQDTYGIDVSSILVIDSGQIFHNEKMISSKPVYSIDENAKAEIKFNIGEAEYNAEYKETLFYPVGEWIAHKYFVDGDEKKPVFVNDNGDLVGILYKYVYLDISETASPEEVLEKLKPELSKIADLSYYSKIKMPELDSNPNGFGLYEYILYNEENGYITDCFSALVRDNGLVCGFKMNNLPKKDIGVNIDKAKGNKAIELKMKHLFNTDKTKYISHEVKTENPRIVIYEGKVYVRYSVSAVYYDIKNKTEEGSWLFDILVPLDMINN